MDQVLDVLENNFITIENKPRKFIDQDHTIDVIRPFRNESKPFDGRLVGVQENKKQKKL